MDELLPVKDLAVGSELVGPKRVMTRERMQWYGDGLESAVAGKFIRSEGTIHTDDEYARAQGLPGIIADGMISTNYISSMLLRQFGLDYLERGELRTKFIKPVFENVAVSTHGRIRSVEALDRGAVVYVVEVWCEDQDGVKLTVGDARVEVARRGQG